MEGIVCACGASALELYRSSKRLIPTLLDKPRTGKVTGLMVPPRQFLEDDMTARGVAKQPYHVLVDGNHGYNPRRDIHADAGITDADKSQSITITEVDGKKAYKVGNVVG